MPSLTSIQQQSTPTSISSSPSNDPNSPTDPLSQAILLLEKKQRNLGKRKEKLESYEQDAKNGKELNKDQTEALAKYSEVIGQIDCLKDFHDQLKKLQQESNKNQKRLLKQAAEEKRSLVQQRLREYIQLRFLLEHRPTTLKDDEISLFDDLHRLIIPSDYSSISRSIETILLLYHQNVKTLHERNAQEIKEKIDEFLKSFDQHCSTTNNEYSTPQLNQSQVESIKQTPLILHAPPTTPASNLLQHQVSFPLQFDSRDANLPLETILQDSPFFPMESLSNKDETKNCSTLDDIHRMKDDLPSVDQSIDEQWKQSRTGHHHSKQSSQDFYGEHRSGYSHRPTSNINQRMGHRSSYPTHSSHPNGSHRSSHQSNIYQ